MHWNDICLIWFKLYKMILRIKQLRVFHFLLNSFSSKFHMNREFHSVGNTQRRSYNYAFSNRVVNLRFLLLNNNILCLFLIYIYLHELLLLELFQVNQHSLTFIIKVNFKILNKNLYLSFRLLHFSSFVLTS